MTIPLRTRVVLALAALAAAASAGSQPVSRQDSFALGSGAGILCSAQSVSRDPGLATMFDRAYAVTCRDAAVPIGRLYALRLRGADPAARLAALRAERMDCTPAAAGDVDGLARVEMGTCTLRAGDVGYRFYLRRSGNTLYAAEGLAGYDSALRLGLRSLVADRPVEGQVSIATTGAGDPVAFARAQAGSLDPARAMAEAYRRNNEGSFAESAEFFSSLIAADPSGAGRGEALINQALQHSNLGAVEQAATLFGQAEALAGTDPVLSRMLRNYRAIHLMNQGADAAALAELERPLPPAAALIRAPLRAPGIDASTAAQLNAEPPSARGLRAAASALAPAERARIFDAQAMHLRGALLRSAGRRGEAGAPLNRALRELEAVREGRVVSTMWLRAQIHGELARIAEEERDSARAEREHRAAIALFQGSYPDSPALLGARARLASFQDRSGRTDDALAGFRAIVDDSAARGTASPALRRALAPYFTLLVREAERRPEAAADMFKASQLLVRPGVAQTQAVLARELSGGNDEAARLFRQSVDLSRDVERARAGIARLSATPVPAEADTARLVALRDLLARLEADQVATQSKLADFPRYRIVSDGAMALADLQSLLRPGEAYYKMVVIGGDAYALFATPDSARLYRVGARPAELEREVDALRSTISVVREGQVLTYPFDVALAHRLYGQLFQPVAAEMRAVRHLVFEPDGALLRLPPNLLVTERAGVDAYLARAARPGDEGFDFTGVQWLGRDRDVSTAVSVRAFRDVRRIPPSRAPKAYLGFGENRQPEERAVVRNAVQTLLGENPDCAWPLGQWARPISSAELVDAGNTLRREGEGGSDIVTGDAFSDSAIRQRSDLRDYRIIHFATHGLVTAPRPECPARPALMTSFGGDGSDGLLSFSEIYDLRLDADLVILSACDTAGKASLAATREAGVATGGDFALDGLVRAFVGAGARSVIASHWPVPDDYDATKRLISGLFVAPPGTSVATALRQAEARLMDDPATSHPYYWAGFAIVGDGAAPVLSGS